MLEPEFESAPLLWGPIAGLVTWLWLLALLGLGRKHLNFKNRFLEYANEGSYPFYILHQTVIVLLALGIVELAVPWPVKFLLLVAAAFVMTLRHLRPADTPLGPGEVPVRDAPSGEAHGPRAARAGAGHRAGGRGGRLVTRTAVVAT